MYDPPLSEPPVVAPKSETSEPLPCRGSFAFVSLGCPKNTVDSERMLGLLCQDGYELRAEPEGVDFVVVNTCGFIEDARAESLAVVREMVERKKAGSIRGVIVAGCLAERQKEHVLEEVPEVDQVIGVFGREEIAQAAERVVGRLEEQRTLFRPAPIRAQEDTARLRITPRHLAFLKVSEGCSRYCTFCAIPFMRGDHVTKPIDEVVAEAEELAADGVVELNLVAQDMTYYGVDLDGKPRLAELLRRLDQVEGLRWIRVLYNYPAYFTDELYEILAKSEKIIPYLDMPLQHINDTMLKRMNRRHTRAETEAILDRLRATIPGLVMRTTFIVGFPGETEEAFEELLDFVRQARFERLGVFPYSDEPDTPAARLPNRIPDDVKQDRRNRVMAAQQEVAFAFQQSLVGQTLDVLIDGPAGPAHGPGVWRGRSYADAPDVDGLVYVRDRRLRPGDLIPCEIIAAEDYDLVARPVETSIPARKRRPRPKAKKPPASKSPFTILS